VNDAPTATNLTQALAYTEDQGALALGDIVVTDVDTGATITATLTLSDAAAGTLSTGTFGSATSTFDAGTGVWTVTGSQADVNAALAAVSFTPAANYFSDVTITTRIRDDADTGPADGTITLTGTAVEDDPVAVADSDSVLENTTLVIDVTANDTDVDGGQKDVVMINGVAAVVGSPIALASGARVTLNADGTLTYNPNGAFNYLISQTKADATGAINVSADDVFTYSLNGGSQTSVTVTVNGVDGMGDQLVAPAGTSALTGTADPDVFILTATGDHDVSGLGSDDGFFFEGAFDSGDQVDGGAGNDQLGLRGTYNMVINGTMLTNVETISLLSGTSTKFGGPTGVPTSYSLAVSDAVVAAGQTLVVNGGGLAAGEGFAFNGSAETNGNFIFFGGMGTETLTGGAGNDGFYFGEGRFNAGDTVDGGAGADDQLALRGNFTIDFDAVGYAGALTNIDTIALLSSVDTRFGNGPGPFSYSITMNDAAVAAGARMNVNGGGLLATEQMVFDGSRETDGSFRIIGGAANDILIGGAGDDRIYGGLGADQMGGNGGAAWFIYYDAAESTSASRDSILFQAGVDKIDLRGMDAITGGANDAFSFIGTDAFDGVTAGQLRIEDQGGGRWLVQGDVNGDGFADLEIAVELITPGSLTATDFYP
jgi:VCBS repeat-containing protein